MRKILTFILILCSVAAIAQMRGGALYDPGAIRSDGTNASDTVTLNRLKTATGTAAAPAYSFSSDPNTGIYSPAADTIGFSAAGAEAMHVNSAGEVLIATSTDAGDYKLQVNGNAYVNGSIRTTGNGAFGFGTADNPSIGFIGSDDGFYKLSADNFFAGINGITIMGFDNNGAYMNNGVFRLVAKTPASATAAGITGTICWDASYIYICTATNTWKRVAISSW